MIELYTLLGFMIVAALIAIELKDHKGRATPEQLEWLDHLKAEGWLTGVCRTFDHARMLVDAAQRRRR